MGLLKTSYQQDNTYVYIYKMPTRVAILLQKDLSIFVVMPYGSETKKIIK